MLNKYPGNCACGIHVAKSKGTLKLSDGVFSVMCATCGVGAVSGLSCDLPTGTASRSPRRRKASSTSTESKPKRRSSGGVRRTSSAKGTRRPKKTTWKQRIIKRAKALDAYAIRPPTPTASMDPKTIPNDLGTLIPNPHGEGWLPCSETYANILNKSNAARLRKDATNELDLLVTLAELSLFGHVGKPISQAEMELAA
jgi:hypothetical protein